MQSPSIKNGVRRMSDVMASPFRLMSTVADVVADYLVAPPPTAQPSAKPAQQSAAAPAAVASVAPAAAAAAPRKRAAGSKPPAKRPAKRS